MHIKERFEAGIHFCSLDNYRICLSACVIFHNNKAQNANTVSYNIGFNLYYSLTDRTRA